jgi:hypothetical protein
MIRRSLAPITRAAFERSEVGADQARDAHPSREPDDDHDVPDGRLQNGDDGEDQEERWKAEHNVHKPHDDGVDPPAVVTGNGAQNGAEENGNARGDKADLQGNTGAPDHA